MSKTAWAMSVLLMAGCAAPLKEPKGSAATKTGSGSGVAGGTNKAGDSRPSDVKPVVDVQRNTRWMVRPEDPPLILRPQVNLSIVRVAVPAGAVSRGDGFWRRVDEQGGIDVATYDLLYKNGLRVGQAPLAELENFTRMLESLSGRTPEPAIFAAAGTRGIELSMRKNVQDAVLYDFDARDIMTVKSYEDCDLFMALEFGAAPRKPNEVRISFVPAVRTLRRRIVPVGDAEVREFEVKAAEKFFNLNVKADVPLDRFLILAPSPEARSSMSLGHAFLTRDGGTERVEEVLLLIPQALRSRPQPPVEAKAGQPQQGRPGTNQ